jgi:hypothetical protein
MLRGQIFSTEEKFAELDCNPSRLEKRFVRAMETLSKQPDKYQYGFAARTGRRLRAYPGISPRWTGIICRHTIIAQAKCNSAR